MKMPSLKLVVMLEYRNVFAKGYVLNWSEEVFILQKLKLLFCGLMLLVILEAKKLLGRFTKKIAKNKSKSV